MHVHLIIPLCSPLALPIICPNILICNSLQDIDEGGRVAAVQLHDRIVFWKEWSAVKEVPTRFKKFDEGIEYKDWVIVIATSWLSRGWLSVQRNQTTKPSKPREPSVRGLFYF